MSSSPQRRAHRLVALYPRLWRERFGDEFEQLLVDELDANPRSARRTADVAVHAVLAHFTAAGLAGRGLAPDLQVARGLRALGVVVALFVVVATAIWTGLDVGWTWAAPTAPDTRAAIVTMSAALLGLVVLAALSSVLIAAAIVWAPYGRSARRRRALLVLVVCAAAFAVGCVHFAGQWPGGRDAGWGEHSIMPSAVAQLAWAGTQWVTAYWLHPHALASLPGARLIWSIVSPLLLFGVAAAALAVTRSLVVPPAVTRALTAASGVAGVLGALFVASAASWILSAGTGPRAIFQAGSLDRVALGVLALALVAGTHIGCRVATAHRQLRSR